MLNIQRVSGPMKDKILTKAIRQKCSHSQKHRHIHAHRHEHTHACTYLTDTTVTSAQICTAHTHTHTHTHTQRTKLLTLPVKNDGIIFYRCANLWTAVERLHQHQAAGWWRTGEHAGGRQGGPRQTSAFSAWLWLSSVNFATSDFNLFSITVTIISLFCHSQLQLFQRHFDYHQLILEKTEKKKKYSRYMPEREMTSRPQWV